MSIQNTKQRKYEMRVQLQYGKKNKYPTKTVGPSLTQQQFKAECNVNNIMEKYQKTGLVDHVNKNEPRYGDIISIDYKSSMDLITSANSMFAELPSQTRKYFENDPTKFMDFVQNPENKEKLYEMGLAERSHITVDKKENETSHAGEGESDVAPATSGEGENT